MWPLRTGGWDEKGEWQRGFGAYVKHFHRTADDLTGACSRSAAAAVAAVAAVPDGAQGDGIAEADRAAFEAERAETLRGYQTMLLAAMGAVPAPPRGERVCFCFTCVFVCACACVCVCVCVRARARARSSAGGHGAAGVTRRGARQC
jgi:hypothetical protein